MAKGKGNKIYILTVEYSSETDEIEYIQEEIIDDVDLDSQLYGEIDLEENDFEPEVLEYIRGHYNVGEA
tara:strand:- start:1883 stop:2089 length:207 start_codon:yes stop_codon:yes gene_type:complete